MWAPNHDLVFASGSLRSEGAKTASVTSHILRSDEAGAFFVPMWTGATPIEAIWGTDSLDIYAVRQPGTERAADALAAQAAADPRIAIRAPVAADAVTATMADYDVIAIPSRWLETGPLVALEAFAAGVPVIGSDLGGIREIVRDGVDGLLVSADQPAAWAATLDRLAREPALLATLRDNILPPRTMHDCAADMAMLYDGLLAPADRTIGAHS